MSVAGSQQQTFLRLLRHLRSRWRGDQALAQHIQQLLVRQRTFGARDRRLYRELIYTTLRYLPWIEPWLDREPNRAVQIAAWLAAETRDTHAFRAEACPGWPGISSEPSSVRSPGFSRNSEPAEAGTTNEEGSKLATTPSLAERAAFLQADAAELLPGWFRDHCPALFAPPELGAQLARAPLWLRLQTSEPEKVFAEFAEQGWQWSPAPALPDAIRLETEADVTKSVAYRDGRIEIQDLGSQMILASLGLESGGRWLDACAGAGGKSLQLARLIGPAGTVEAYDIRPAALKELAARAARAGLANLRTTSRPSAGDYASVLVDAPCSGSGTWRRSPHLKWTTTPALIAARAELQQKLLARYAVCVRPGGRLVYATCSLSHRENEDIVAAFLATHADFAPEPFATTFGFQPHAGGFTLLPSRYDTDGFFVSSLRRR